jgi:hypothetical protein
MAAVTHRSGQLRRLLHLVIAPRFQRLEQIRWRSSPA